MLTFHSTEWGRNGNLYGNWWEAKEISHREWLGGYECSAVITISTILKDEIQQIYQIPDYKFWEIPNGINVGKITGKIGAFPPTYFKPEKCKDDLGPRMQFVGR